LYYTTLGLAFRSRAVSDRPVVARFTARWSRPHANDGARFPWQPSAWQPSGLSELTAKGGQVLSNHV